MRIQVWESNASIAKLVLLPKSECRSKCGQRLLLSHRKTNKQKVLLPYLKEGDKDICPTTKARDKEKKKKESILDLSKYIDKTIRVKFQGGREASGVLKGFDPLLNLVLDGTIEYMRDPDDQFKLTEDTRQLGLVVCRGTSVVLICPQDGMEAIPNPFIQQQDG
ncbi:U6 snRNA-associated Sm-like protein LSm7 [Pitangus sulphuratus]|nr:U6 snRNA-associated Sm-like protein LSm7 [Pitangus sulphuratus]